MTSRNDIRTPVTIAPEQQATLARLIRIQEAMRLGRGVDSIDDQLTITTDPSLREAEEKLRNGRVEALSVGALVMAIVSGRALQLHTRQLPLPMRLAIVASLASLERYFEETDLVFQGPALIA